jgi:hypothetical protein
VGDSGSAAADGSGGPQLGTRFSAEEIHQNILNEAEAELGRPARELLLSGLASGLGIGFSFVAVALLRSRMGPESHALAAGLGYPLGFVFVVLARHQLFTENTLEPVIPLLERRDRESLRMVARLWAKLPACPPTTSRSRFVRPQFRDWVRSPRARFQRARDSSSTRANV